MKNICKNMDDKTSIKILQFAFWMLILLYIIPILYSVTMKNINKNPSILYLYASNGKFVEDIYLTRNVDTNCFVEELLEILSNEEEVRSYVDFCVCLNDNMDRVKELAETNVIYKNYLKANDTSIEALCIWISKIAGFQDRLLFAVLYIYALVMFIVMVIAFNYRRIFYTLASVIYFINILAGYTEGFTDILVTFILDFLGKLVGESVVYYDMVLYRELFSDTLKEAMLTFIIIDTLVQIFVSCREERNRKERLYIYEAVCSQIEYFRKYENKFKGTFCGSMSKHLPVSNLLKELEKYIKVCEKKKKRYKNLNVYKERSVFLQRLYDNIIILYNGNGHNTVDKYIEILETVKRDLIDYEYAGAR